jgi:pimeloyl-ACP methyl ester carboxylesterase
MRMGRPARQFLLLARRFPTAARLLLRSQTRAFRRDPESVLSGLVRRWSASDREMILRGAVRTMFLGDLEELLVRGQGAENLIQEIQLYFRWGFRLDDLPRDRKVLLWHGGGDTLVPPAMSHYVARRLGRSAETRILPGGHLMVLDALDEILKRVRSLMEEGADGSAANGSALGAPSAPVA